MDAQLKFMYGVWLSYFKPFVNTFSAVPAAAPAKAGDAGAADTILMWGLHIQHPFAKPVVDGDKVESRAYPLGKFPRVPANEAPPPPHTQQQQQHDDSSITRSGTCW